MILKDRQWEEAKECLNQLKIEYAVLEKELIIFVEQN